ncbi:MAG: LURP-one-related family protein [Oscillospiraceae bacterium]|nr:LURP-one-related family protein [Oscillospiraceae bacterium]
MTLYLQEELFSLDHFGIWDEDGNVKYQVERELFQFARKLVVVDMQGREVCFVQHIPFSIPCAYELAVPGGSVRLDRHFSFFTQQYTIDELGWKVAGSFMSLDFEIMQGDRRVAYIEKAFPAFHDRYRLEIEDPKDELTALCVVLAIDVEAERHN